MRDCGAAEDESSTKGRPAEKFVVCAGGYPLSRLPTFAAAAEQASAFVRFMPSSEISIYEIASGIHFDVPARGRVNKAQAEPFLSQPE